MTAKSFLSLSLGLVLALAPALSFAQAFHNITFYLYQEMEAELAKEPPLTQADVDGYIKILSSVDKKAGDAGWTESHFRYVAAKVHLAQGLAQGATAEALRWDQFPPATRPGEAETALVKNNLPALRKVGGVSIEFKLL